ncbi:MAG: phosphodiester glycosidase family protein [Bacteroidaceae bacterium]|nr:phosphodiester glycosidase family protein [Bacteroidaceae bacterium]
MNKLKIFCVAMLCILMVVGCAFPTVAQPTAPTETTDSTVESVVHETSETTIPDNATEDTEATDSTTQPTESTTVPTEPTITTTEPTTVPTEPEPTKPTETIPPETKPPVTYTEVNETVYAVSTVNIRKGPGTEYDKVGSLSVGDSIVRIGIGSNGWSKVLYNDVECYMFSDYLSTSKPVSNTYPMVYSDDTCTITITKEWHYNAWCYIAHLEFTDYSRFASAIAKNNRGSSETTSSAANRQNAIFCVNGPYNWGELKDAYAIIRNGVVYNDKGIEKDLGIYNANTGVLMRAEQLGINGMLASEAAANGLATDTFKFWNSTLVLNGQNISNADNSSRAQRTFIATNGNPGDIYVIVSEGRKADGESSGLTKYECAKVVLDLGCTYGVMLDGGGSSTMWFNGRVINSAYGNERSLVDFVYFRKE